MKIWEQWKAKAEAADNEIARLNEEIRKRDHEILGGHDREGSMKAHLDAARVEIAAVTEERDSWKKAAEDTLGIIDAKIKHFEEMFGTPKAVKPVVETFEDPEFEKELEAETPGIVLSPETVVHVALEEPIKIGVIENAE